MSPYANKEDQRAWAKRYYVANREKKIAAAVAWNKANPERRKEIKSAWVEKNPDYAREWYLANRERVIARGRIMYRKRLKANPDQVRALQREIVARRRARLRDSFVEKVDPLLVWERDDGVCGICGESADASDWHLDHIVPIARGGAHSYANVQVAHPDCNWRKAAS